jgi:hypothetical protein
MQGALAGASAHLAAQGTLRLQPSSSLGQWMPRLCGLLRQGLHMLPSTVAVCSWYEQLPINQSMLGGAACLDTIQVTVATLTSPCCLVASPDVGPDRAHKPLCSFVVVHITGRGQGRVDLQTAGAAHHVASGEGEQ